jgi:hypothetical protein
MPDLILLRSYPGPGEKWNTWQVSVDGRSVGAIGGAGCLSVDVDSGQHRVVVTGGRNSVHEYIIRSTDEPEVLLVYRDMDGHIAIADGKTDTKLPRSSIPLYSPTGTPQTYSQGRKRALIAIGIFVTVSVVMIAASLGLLIYVTVSKQTPPAGTAVILLLLGLWLLFKMRPGLRLLRYQRDGPLEQLRVEHKGDELVEWKRSPDADALGSI